MKISIIVAAATNNVIGHEGELPWRLPEDLRRFRHLTSGKPIIMGRLTYESIGRPLPERTNIILSRQEGLVIEGCQVVSTPEAAIELAGDADEVMVIGGGTVYAQMLPLADRIYLTRVTAVVDGDTYFPAIDDQEWRVVDREDFPADESRRVGFSFLTLDRVSRRGTALA
ncbi:MAG: dihydrofolate reductase [Woeseiaceae bacterium]